MRTYDAFLDDKRQLGRMGGFDPVYMPDFLFDFQRAIVDWSVRKGRGAIFADCGLGKTPMQLVWAENVARHTDGRVLILTPLAVSHQTVNEGAKFGIDCERSADGAMTRRVVVTNYERLHYFNPGDFKAVVCDESSILKNFDGARKAAITDFMRKVPYRLLCTATASPNDYIELGNSSEALGELGYMDMLSRFFKNDQNSCDTGGHKGRFDIDGKGWRFKWHAEKPFWRWVASWARACRKPSDLGFDDGKFILPALTEREHMVKPRSLRDGFLMELPAIGLKEQREETARTVAERCEMVAGLVNGTGKPALVWCNLNREGDLLERLIPDSVQVSGGDSDDRKEELLLGFAQGKSRVLVTKPKIGCLGLNLQHCAHVTFFMTHSYESYYQGVRRCWRFGQHSPVTVDIVATDGQEHIMRNLRRKAEAANRMFTELVSHMNQGMRIDSDRSFNLKMETPSWLSQNSTSPTSTPSTAATA